MNRTVTIARNTLRASFRAAALSRSSTVPWAVTQGLTVRSWKMLTSLDTDRLRLAAIAAGYLSRGDVLRYEVLDGARHAVVVGPAIDHRQGRAKVAVLRRGVGGLPLQRG